MEGLKLAMIFLLAEFSVTYQVDVIPHQVTLFPKWIGIAILIFGCRMLRQSLAYDRFHQFFSLFFIYELLHKAILRFFYEHLTAGFLFWSGLISMLIGVCVLYAVSSGLKELENSAGLQLNGSALRTSILLRAGIDLLLYIFRASIPGLLSLPVHIVLSVIPFVLLCCWVSRFRLAVDSKLLQELS